MSSRIISYGDVGLTSAYLGGSGFGFQLGIAAQFNFNICSINYFLMRDLLIKINSTF